VGTIIMGARFCAFLAKVTWHWVPNQRAVFLAQVFFTPGYNPSPWSPWLAF